MEKRIIIALSLAITVSCLKQEESLNTIKAPALNCYTEVNLSSKTSISVGTDGVGTIYWEPSDAIAVFFGTEKVKYVSENKDKDMNVVFEATEDLDGTKADFSNIWGLYPYDLGTMSNGTFVTVTIPAYQKCTKNTFGSDLFPMIAHSSSNELQFKNVCGGIKFSLSRDDIQKITFSGNNDEDIVGKFKVVMDNDGKPAASVISGGKTITLSPAIGKTFKRDTYYYIILTPCELTKGFTMVFDTGEFIGTFKYCEKNINIKRSIFCVKENVDVFASYKIKLPDNAVDLGLSVMWATCNLGAMTSEECGNYYAWGEIEAKSTYTKENYNWYDKQSDTYIKYWEEHYNVGNAWGQNILELDDAVYTKLGSRWRMPSVEEVYELIENCIYIDTTFNGVTGVKIKSKINGNSIFFPHSGFFAYESEAYKWKNLYYRTTTDADVLYSEGSGDKLYVGVLSGHDRRDRNRYGGMPIRPVFDVDNRPNVLPDNPDNGIIDLGLSVKWRSRNLGASKPEERGEYFQWAGKRDVFDASNNVYWSLCPYATHIGSNTEFWKYSYKDGKLQLEDIDDAATIELGGGWRMPTYNEFYELINKCKWTRTIVNGILGYRVQSKVDGYTDKWIFLPSTGIRQGFSYTDLVCGFYWSSELKNNSYSRTAYCIGNNSLGCGTRYSAMPIRPVTEQE